jgi:hypothetical protein
MRFSPKNPVETVTQNYRRKSVQAILGKGSQSRTISSQATREELVQMAQTWLRLAEEQEAATLPSER